MSISDSNLVDSNYFMHTALTAIIQYDETKISLSQPNAILSQQKNQWNISTELGQSEEPILFLDLVFSKWVEVLMMDYISVFRSDGVFTKFCTHLVNVTDGRRI